VQWCWREAQGGGPPLWRVPALEATGAGAAFSSRLGGCSAAPYARCNLGLSVGDEPACVAENRRRFAVAAGFPPEATVRADQVHGSTALAVFAPGEAGAADGLCTDQPGLVLTIAVADCAVVYLLDPVVAAIGLCHAGWRGTVADVVGSTVARMARAFGTRPRDLVAAVSPAIGPCCYEVAAPVTAAMAGAAPWGASMLRPTRPGHALLDLWGANRRRLLDAGVPATAIHVAGVCTACHGERLYSHRRDRGRTGRMDAALWWPGAAP